MDAFVFIVADTELLQWNSWIQRDYNRMETANLCPEARLLAIFFWGVVVNLAFIINAWKICLLEIGKADL